MTTKEKRPSMDDNFEVPDDISIQKTRYDKKRRIVKPNDSTNDAETNYLSAAKVAEEEDPDEQEAESGISLEPFNMRREMTEGRFDEDGNYVWNNKNNKKEFRDSWLDTVDAGLSSSNFKDDDERDKIRSLQDSEAAAAPIDVIEVLRRLIKLLRRSETSAAALKRYKRLSKTSKTNDEEEEESPMVKFNAVTDCCDMLLAHGINAYFTIREELEEQLQRYLKDESSIPVIPNETPQIYWQFRWIGADEIHGPFDASTFISWIQQGYISTQHPIELRRVTKDNEVIKEEWTSWDAVDFNQIIEDDSDDSSNEE